MSENLTQKELLIRLMDKVDSIEKEQAEHHTYSRSKLESIESQAIKTNGRVLKLEESDRIQDKRLDSMKVVFTTLSAVLTIAWTGITFFFKDLI